TLSAPTPWTQNRRRARAPSGVVTPRATHASGTAAGSSEAASARRLRAASAARLATSAARNEHQRTRWKRSSAPGPRRIAGSAMTGENGSELEIDEPPRVLGPQKQSAD